jgi:hypothetical protein
MRRRLASPAPWSAEASKIGSPGGISALVTEKLALASRCRGHRPHFSGGNGSIDIPRSGLITSTLEISAARHTVAQFAGFEQSTDPLPGPVRRGPINLAQMSSGSATWLSRGRSAQPKRCHAVNQTRLSNASGRPVYAIHIALP